MSTVRIYACGGTGIAIGKKVSDLSLSKGAAVPKIVFCDTSKSDMRVGFEKLDKYILSNIDGAGKRQGEHALPIRNAIPELLEEHPPAELNIIIASTSGGTGSTFSIELAKVLIAAGHPVIIQYVVTSEDGRATQNSINTLKHLNHVSQKSNLPIVLDLTHQQNGSDEALTDKDVTVKIATLLVLGGGHNEGLDTRDVNNFIFFPQVTDVKPRLLLLDLRQGELAISDLERDDIVTLIEVTPKDGAPSDVSALYRATGHGLGESRILAATHAGNFKEVINYLEGVLDDINTRLALLETPAIDTDDLSEDDFYS